MLPKETYKSTVAAICDRLSNSTHESESRSKTRHRLAVKTSIQLRMANGEMGYSFPAWTDDIGDEGISFLTDREFSPGSIVYVDLQKATSPDNDDSMLAPVLVIHCEKLTPTIVRVGAKFLFDYE